MREDTLASSFGSFGDTRTVPVRPDDRCAHRSLIDICEITGASGVFRVIAV